MHNSKPTIKELGLDLLVLNKTDLILTLATPFVFFCSYFFCATSGLWVLAVISAMGLSFASYGSTSHDLVHNNLKINRSLNSVLLSILELICFRSGHAYKLSHLYHHKRYPNEDDVEGSAARMSLVRTLFEGVIFQFKIYWWAIVMHRDHKYFKMILAEGAVIVILISFCIYSLTFTNVCFFYMCLMVSGSWIIPLVTSYAVHTPGGLDELHQTRLFRGAFFSLIAFNHLFHLEHHMYPMVPHKNWRKRAKRLDAYFGFEGVRPIEVKFKSS